MDLDRIAVAIRPRNHWESIDLGFRMVREHWKPLYIAWACVLLPVVCLTHLLFNTSLGWAVVVIWWLKPIMDRALLIVLSRAVFDAVPTLGETLRALPGAVSNGWLHALTLARLDVTRSFSMPVWQLEGLRGAARRSRVQTIKRRTSTAAFWHTIVCWQLEGTVYLGLVLLLLWMVPEQLTAGWDVLAFFQTMPVWAEWTSNGLYVLAVLVMEPLYVAGGFSLYLNRRTQLEGWDIEIAFRRMLPRIAERRLHEVA